MKCFSTVSMKSVWCIFFNKLIVLSVIFSVLIILAWVELDIHVDFFFQIYQRGDIGSNSSTIHLLTSSTLMMTEDTTIKGVGIVINVYGALVARIHVIAGIIAAGISIASSQLNWTIQTTNPMIMIGHSVETKRHTHFAHVSSCKSSTYFHQLHT